MQNTQNQAVVRKAIRNIATMSDAQLVKVLADHGYETPEQVTRPQLIRLAREAGLWGHDGNIMPGKFKAKYKALGGNNGDVVAVAMSGMEESDLASVAVANNVDYSRWSHCNFGQRRMNLSNVLRGKIRRGESVIVGLYEWDNKELISQPEEEAKSDTVEAPTEEVVAETVAEPESQDDGEVETH